MSYDEIWQDMIRYDNIQEVMMLYIEIWEDIINYDKVL